MFYYISFFIRTGGKKMTSMTSLKVTNWLIFISAAVQAISGATQFFLRPRAVISVHMVNAPIFVILVVIHIALNWGWMKTQMFGSKKQIQPRKAVREAA
jgi:hypothetical protein